MSLETSTLEPFPLFVDSVDPTRPNFLSKMSALHVLSPSGASSLRKSQANATTQFTNYLSLRYYQYECTFGLYVMQPIEKVIINTVVIGIFAAIFYAMYFGLQPFVVRSLCHMIYYMTGGINGVEDVCENAICS